MLNVSLRSFKNIAEMRPKVVPLTMVLLLFLNTMPEGSKACQKEVIMRSQQWGDKEVHHGNIPILF